jgi:hypothetical protein
MTFVWYYAVLLAVFTGWIFRVRRQRLAWAGLVLVSALWLADWATQRGTARLDVLALRGAPAVFAAGSGTQPRLAGRLRQHRIGRRNRQTVPLGAGVNRLDDFCLTAGYQQSMGGAEIVLTNFAPAAVFTGPARVRSPAYRRVEAELARAPGLLPRCGTATHWTAGRFFTPARKISSPRRTKFPWPCNETFAATPFCSFRAGRDGTNPADEPPPELRAEIVVAGLPSRDEPLIEPLLDMLRPKLIIIADSELPPTAPGRPNCANVWPNAPARASSTAATPAR